MLNQGASLYLAPRRLPCICCYEHSLLTCFLSVGLLQAELPAGAKITTGVGQISIELLVNGNQVCVYDLAMYVFLKTSIRSIQQHSVTQFVAYVEQKELLGLYEDAHNWLLEAKLNSGIGVPPLLSDQKTSPRNSF